MRLFKLCEKRSRRGFGLALSSEACDSIDHNQEVVPPLRGSEEGSMADNRLNFQGEDSMRGLYSALFGAWQCISFVPIWLLLGTEAAGMQRPGAFARAARAQHLEEQICQVHSAQVSLTRTDRPQIKLTARYGPAGCICAGSTKQGSQSGNGRLHPS